MLDYTPPDHVAGRGIDGVEMLSCDQTEALFLGNLFEDSVGYTTSAEPPDHRRYAALMHTLREKLTKKEAIVGNRDFSRFALHLIQTVGGQFPIFARHTERHYARVFLEAELGEPLTLESIYRWLGTLYVERRQPHMPERPSPDTLEMMARTFMARHRCTNVVDAYVSSHMPTTPAEWDERARGIAGDVPGLFSDVHAVCAIQAVCDGVHTSAKGALSALHTAVHEAMQLAHQVREDVTALSAHASPAETSMWHERTGELTQQIRTSITTILDHGKAMLAPIPSLLREGRIELSQLRATMRSAIERISAYDSIIRHIHTFFEQHGALKMLRTEVNVATQRAARTNAMSMTEPPLAPPPRKPRKTRTPTSKHAAPTSRWRTYLKEWGTQKNTPTHRNASHATPATSIGTSQKAPMHPHHPPLARRRRSAPSAHEAWWHAIARWLQQ